MHVLFEALKKEPSFNALLGDLERGRTPVALSGVERTHKVLIAAAAAEITERPLLILCRDELECEKCASELSALTGKSECHQRQDHQEDMHQRLRQFAALLVRLAVKIYLMLMPAFVGPYQV